MLLLALILVVLVLEDSWRGGYVRGDSVNPFWGF